MKILFRFVLQISTFLFCAAVPSFAQTPPHYAIKVNVDVEHKNLHGAQAVVFTNNSRDEIKDIVFHIYPNRYYNKKEQGFLARFAGYFKVNPFPEGLQTGAMKIYSVKDDQSDLPFVIEGTDKTILRITLSKSLPPGASVNLSLDFSVDIPHISLGRFGWNNHVYRLSHWYPVLAVYEEKKGWNTTPFYPFHRPFFSDASHYQVELNVAQDQVIAHSGIQRDEQNNSDGTKTIQYESEFPLRDFTFAMSPDYQTVNGDFEGIQIVSYYLPGDEEGGKAAIQDVKDLMGFYTQLFGKYPYSRFSIAPVDLGYGGEQMSNMIFIDRRAYEMPGFMRRYFDFLVAHETGHQWFYNVVGANEYREMWLEEGVNSYFIEQYLTMKYGEDGEVIDFPKWAEKGKFFLPKLTFKKTRDTRYKMIARIGKDHEIISGLGSFTEPSAIFSVTYGKGARVLGMLRHYIGEKAFTNIFKRIYAEYRFKNLSVTDFIRISEEEFGAKLSWFFDQWLFEAKQLDYSITGVKPLSNPFAAFPNSDRVDIENRGTVEMPVDLKISYKDGSVQDAVFNGKDHFVTGLPGKTILRADLDPQEKLLDLDQINNHWPRHLYIKPVPIYLPLYEIPVFLPEDGYSLIAGPAAVDGGLGIKASIQKPYDQIAYAWSSYEFGEKLHHSGVGYQLKNVLNTQTALGFELANTKDYKDGTDDLASGKIYLRRELWPAQYSVTDINDHVSLYFLRNQSIHDRAGLTSGAEAIHNTDYSRSESIVGASLHLDRSGTSPDPSQGYRLDALVENSGHFLGATQYFYRSSVEGDFYMPVTAGTKTALRLKAGGGYPNDKELFYAGGMDGLRGYALKDVRGANVLLGSLEYRFPLISNLKISIFDHMIGLEEIGGVIFADAGEAWFSAIDSSPLRKDAGIGLRCLLNVGGVFEKVIVRFDVAQAINDDHEDEPRFWFGLNHAF